MKAQGRPKRVTERVPVVPLSEWDDSEATRLTRLPEKRQEYSGRPIQVTTPGCARFYLLFATRVNDHTVVFASASEVARAWRNTSVHVVENGIETRAYHWRPDDSAGRLVPDAERPNNWHIARAIATAKVAAATLREATAPAPRSADANWLRQQLATLNAGRG